MAWKKLAQNTTQGSLLGAATALVGLSFLTAGASAQVRAPQFDALSVEAKVHMNVESAPGTPREAAETLGGATGQAITPIRKCYRKATNDHLDLDGHIKYQVRKKAGAKKLQVKLLEDTVGRKDLERCVAKEMRRVSLKGKRLSRTTTVYAHVVFGADQAVKIGKKRMARGKKEASRATAGSKGYEVVSKTAEGQITVRVHGDPGASKASVEAIHRGVRKALPTLLDCRRKIAKRVSPAGNIQTSIKLGARGKAKVKVTKVTVPSPKAAPNPKTCLTSAMKRASFEPSASGHAEVTFEFAGADPTHPRK